MLCGNEVIFCLSLSKHTKIPNEKKKRKDYFNLKIEISFKNGKWYPEVRVLCISEYFKIG